MIHALLAASFVTLSFLCLGADFSTPPDSRHKVFGTFYLVSLICWLSLAVMEKSFGLIMISVIQVVGLVPSLFSLAKENLHETEI